MGLFSLPGVATPGPGYVLPPSPGRPPGSCSSLARRAGEQCGAPLARTFTAQTLAVGQCGADAVCLLLARPPRVLQGGVVSHGSICMLGSESRAPTWPNFILGSLVWLPAGIVATAAYRGMGLPVKPQAWLTLVVIAPCGHALGAGLPAAAPPGISARGMGCVRGAGLCDDSGRAVRGAAWPAGDCNLCSDDQSCRSGSRPNGWSRDGWSGGDRYAFLKTHAVLTVPCVYLAMLQLISRPCRRDPVVIRTGCVAPWHRRNAVAASLPGMRCTDCCHRP